MKTGRWTAVSQSAFGWEQEALDFLRNHLPDHEPWRTWSNFEFIDDEGRVNEVDALVLTPFGFVFIEVKSRPGSVRGDAYSWTWTTEGRQLIADNPLPLANRKAKRLASVLRRQEAIAGRGLSRAALWVEPLIFLSARSGPAPAICSSWPIGSSVAACERSRWNPPASIGYLPTNCSSSADSRWRWSTPATPSTCRAARPTSATPNG